MKLPLNCIADYYHDFLSKEEAAELYQCLIDDYRIHESQRTIEAGGRMIKTDSFKILFVTERLLEINSHPEHIHGKNHLWEGPMAKLREKVEQLTGREYELAMALYYPDGNYHAPYHFDQQTSGHNTILPSLSLGEVREFAFKENDTGEVYSLDLADGSLLVMGDYCQNRYEHSLLKNPKYTRGRINITFREPSFQ
jgi:alkylated DNA repair dioxygenase AlkB